MDEARVDDEKDEGEREYKKPPKRYRRAMRRSWERLEDAAAMTIIAGLEREFFVEWAGRAYDFVKRWHDVDGDADDHEAAS